ncbi:MAG TPA: glycosyltransferase 87 family protein, partial [Candidatus Acidoferrum sp.]|nr:glycosyltransferase 87 family protein [Candidatus Acidoferrum sp.]
MSLFVGITLLNFTTNKDNLDFSEFYGAAQMVRQGHGKDLYDLDLQAEFQSRVAAVHAVYLRPPFETLLFVPLTYVSYRTAYTLWTLANVAFLALAAFLIESRTGIALAVAQ